MFGSPCCPTPLPTPSLWDSFVPCLCFVRVVACVTQVPNATLVLVATGTVGTLTLSSVSILPLAGITMGTLRADVVAALSSLEFQGPLRCVHTCIRVVLCVCVYV